LPPEEQAKVVLFAYRLDAERQLTGKELSSLAERMVATADPVQTAMLREEITRGFYGGKPHA
jgi:predicted outer membrane protein